VITMTNEELNDLAEWINSGIKLAFRSSMKNVALDRLLQIQQLITAEFDKREITNKEIEDAILLIEQTAKNAFVKLERLKDGDPYRIKVQRDLRLFDVAHTALQEYDERTQPCEWCKDIDSMYGIFHNKLYHDWESRELYLSDWTWCPNCNRRINNDANEPRGLPEIQTIKTTTDAGKTEISQHEDIS
jgi:hypothetical protein